MSWSDRYIGLPYRDRGRDHDGADCWGLVRLVYREALAITLPSYLETYASLEERAEIAAAIGAKSARYPWRRIATGDARGFDLVLFQRGGIADHVGIVVAPSAMLHVARGSEAVIAPYDETPWSGRLVGLYRHAAVPA